MDSQTRAPDANVHRMWLPGATFGQLAQPGDRVQVVPVDDETQAWRRLVMLTALDVVEAAHQRRRHDGGPVRRPPKEVDYPTLALELADLAACAMYYAERCGGMTVAELLAEQRDCAERAQGIEAWRPVPDESAEHTGGDVADAGTVTAIASTTRQGEGHGTDEDR